MAIMGRGNNLSKKEFPLKTLDFGANLVPEGATLELGPTDLITVDLNDYSHYAGIKLQVGEVFKFNGNSMNVVRVEGSVVMLRPLNRPNASNIIKEHRRRQLVDGDVTVLIQGHPVQFTSQDTRFDDRRRVLSVQTTFDVSDSLLEEMDKQEHMPQETIARDTFINTLAVENGEIQVLYDMPGEELSLALVLTPGLLMKEMALLQTLADIRWAIKRFRPEGYEKSDVTIRFKETIA